MKEGRKIELLIVGLILLGVVLGCKAPDQKSETSTSNTSAVEPKPSEKPTSEQDSQPDTIEDLVSLPADFKPSYNIVETRDVSYSNIKRHVTKITLPQSLKREEVEQNFRHAILQTYKEKKSDAISIFGYKTGDDLSLSFSVGEAVFAPNGTWEKASSHNSLQNYKIITKVKDAYLNPPTTIAVGTNVILSDDTLDKVYVSNSPSEWGDGNVVAELKNNTRAQVLEVKEFPTSGSPLIRYKIRTDSVEGWVFGSNLKMPN